MANERKSFPKAWGENAGDNTDPGDPKTQAGWVAEIPPYQNENFNQNKITEMLGHIEVNGIPVWLTDTIYPINGLSLASDGLIYQSQGNSNTGNDPTVDSGANWIPYNQFFMAEYKRIAGTSGIISVSSGVNVFLDDPRWLLCDGQAVDRTIFSVLFARIGVSFGNGNGTTTFNLPDKSDGHVSVDVNGSLNDGSSNIRTLGQNGGEQSHTLTTAEMPSHTHSVPNTAATGVGEFAENAPAGASQTINTGSAGSGNAHNNIQPTLVDGYTFIYSNVVP